MNNELRHLLQLIESADWATACGAAAALAGYGGAALPGLLPLLMAPSAQTRHAAALALREIADDAVVAPLVQAISDPLTAGTRGGLVWALQTHTCADYFLFLFNLTLTDTFEVQNHALTILYEQEFFYTHEDLAAAQAQLDQYASRQDRDPGTAALIADLQSLLAAVRDQAARSTKIGPAPEAEILRRYGRIGADLEGAQR